MRIWPFHTAEKKSLANPEDWLLGMFGVTPTSAGVTVSAQTALAVPTVQSAIRVVSEAAASLAIRVVAIGDDGVETDDRSSPAWSLLRDAPNDWTSGFELVRDLIIDALTRDAGGLAWVNWIDGKPREIIKMPAGCIQVEYDQNTGEPSYRVNGALTSAQNILHLRSPFPRCALTLAREAIGVTAVMERHAGRLFSNGAKPSGVLETPKAVGDEGVKKMLAGWRAAHEGADNSGKTAILWDGTTFKQMALNSVDSQFLELRKFQVLEIANAFRVPPSMLYQLDRATWSNSEQMGREFLTYTLEAWLKALEGALRRALFLGDDRQKFRVIFDRDDLTRADLTARATAINSLRASKVLNANEARSWLDLPPYEGGETFENPNTVAAPSANLPKVDEPKDKPDAVDE